MKPLRWNNWSVKLSANMILPYHSGITAVDATEMLTKRAARYSDFLLMLCFRRDSFYPGFETDIHGAKQDEDGVYRVRVLKMAG